MAQWKKKSSALQCSQAIQAKLEPNTLPLLLVRPTPNAIRLCLNYFLLSNLGLWHGSRHDHERLFQRGIIAKAKIASSIRQAHILLDSSLLISASTRRMDSSPPPPPKISTFTVPPGQTSTPPRRAGLLISPQGIRVGGPEEMGYPLPKEDQIQNPAHNTPARPW